MSDTQNFNNIRALLSSVSLMYIAIFFINFNLVDIYILIKRSQECQMTTEGETGRQPLLLSLALRFSHQGQGEPRLSPELTPS